MKEIEAPKYPSQRAAQSAPANGERGNLPARKSVRPEASSAALKRQNLRSPAPRKRLSCPIDAHKPAPSSLREQAKTSPAQGADATPAPTNSKNLAFTLQASNSDNCQPTDIKFERAFHREPGSSAYLPQSPETPAKTRRLYSDQTTPARFRQSGSHKTQTCNALLRA